MNQEILDQAKFWNSQYQDFDAIYTHRKPPIARALDEIFRKDMYDRFLYTLKNCEPIEGRTFLDVGCGSGRYSVELAKRGARKVTGLDISEKMLKLAEQNAKTNGVEPTCHFERTDLLGWQPPSDIDVSILVGLMDYIREPLAVLIRVRELTRDKAIITFPKLLTWRAPIRKFRLITKGCRVYFYSSGKVVTLLKDAGFSDWKIERVGKLYCVVAFVKRNHL